MIERDRIDSLTNLLTTLEHDLERSEEVRGRQRRGVTVWVRIIALLVAGLALSNLYFVNDLTDEVRVVITRMQEMNALFSRVSKRMDGMQAEVAAIEHNVLLMPVVSEQMREMAAHVLAMEHAVSAMHGSTEGLSDSARVMERNLRDISARFHGLNRSVGAMGVDVNQMGRPLP
ncbi:hypothetical protein [Halochromatium glycolicum]|uniref:Translation initiation factor 2 n=1 Tax=Halochromatium glycolicum TaxID=85075 RepID=A0AAJ0U4L1_9GAMM|nr:hypothetical protein [Halochromatium glycolicum]MBK1705165.1 hypothetical protein [Halochromatium glycolicum]